MQNKFIAELNSSLSCVTELLSGCVEGGGRGGDGIDVSDTEDEVERVDVFDV